MRKTLTLTEQVTEARRKQWERWEYEIRRGKKVGGNPALSPFLVNDPDCYR